MTPVSTPPAAAVELRGGSWRASIPITVLVSLITFGGVIAQRCGPQQNDAELRADVKSQGVAITEIRNTLNVLVDRVNRADDEAKNARLIEALRNGQPLPQK